MCYLEKIEKITYADLPATTSFFQFDQLSDRILSLFLFISPPSTNVFWHSNFSVIAARFLGIPSAHQRNPVAIARTRGRRRRRRRKTIAKTSSRGGATNKNVRRDICSLNWALRLHRRRDDRVKVFAIYGADSTIDATFFAHSPLWGHAAASSLRGATCGDSIRTFLHCRCLRYCQIHNVLVSHRSPPPRCLSSSPSGCDRSIMPAFRSRSTRSNFINRRLHTRGGAPLVNAGFTAFL